MSVTLYSQLPQLASGFTASPFYYLVKTALISTYLEDHPDPCPWASEPLVTRCYQCVVEKYPKSSKTQASEKPSSSLREKEKSKFITRGRR